MKLMFLKEQTNNIEYMCKSDNQIIYKDELK